MHAFEMNLYVDKEGLRRNMKMIHKGIIDDMESVLLGILCFTNPRAIIY